MDQKTERPTPQDILLFTKPGCPFCAKAKRMLSDRELTFEEVRSTPRNLRAVSGQKTSPQVFIDGKHIGGSDDLEKFFSA